MPAQLNHTIVHARDARASAAFLSELLGLREPRQLYHFWIVDTANGVSLDFLNTDEEIQIAHYAFLVSEQEFDEIFARMRQRELPYWADPAAKHPGEINHNDGGRGVYFRDPAGHYLEILTRPYGARESRLAKPE
jgi:catechol 2,3-dioxygenase-like lactoylglutathione lyase family enzyme